MSPKLHEMNSHKLSQSSNFRKESVLHKTTFFFISASYFTCALKSPQTAVAIVPLYVLSSSPFASSTPTEMNVSTTPKENRAPSPHQRLQQHVLGSAGMGVFFISFWWKTLQTGKRKKIWKITQNCFMKRIERKMKFSYAILREVEKFRRSENEKIISLFFMCENSRDEKNP